MPIAIPEAMGDSSFSALINRGPKILPVIPVMITTITVMEGMPPREEDTAKAKGVEILLGNRDKVIVLSKEKSLHRA